MKIINFIIVGLIPLIFSDIAVAARTAMVLYDNVQIYSIQFDTGSKTLGTLNTADSIEVIGQRAKYLAASKKESSWYEVISQNKKGWIAGDELFIFDENRLFGYFTSGTQPLKQFFRYRGGLKADIEKTSEIDSWSFLKRAAKNPNLAARLFAAKRLPYYIPKNPDLQAGILEQISGWVSFQADNEVSVRIAINQSFRQAGYSIYRGATFKDEKIHEHLVKFLERANSKEEVDSLIVILVATNHPQKGQLLLNAAKNNSRVAISALGGHAHPSLSPEARALIVTKLEDEDANIRLTAMYVLARNLDNETVSLLLGRFDEETPLIRSRIINQLSRARSNVPAQELIVKTLINPLADSSVRQVALRVVYYGVKQSTISKEVGLSALKSAYQASNTPFKITMVHMACQGIYNSHQDASNIIFELAAGDDDLAPFKIIPDCLKNVNNYFSRYPQQRAKAIEWFGGWDEKKYEKIKDPDRRMRLRTSIDAIVSYPPGGGIRPSGNLTQRLSRDDRNIEPKDTYRHFVGYSSSDRRRLKILSFFLRQMGWVWPIDAISQTAVKKIYSNSSIDLRVGMVNMACGLPESGPDNDPRAGDYLIIVLAANDDNLDPMITLRNCFGLLQQIYFDSLLRDRISGWPKDFSKEIQDSKRRTEVELYFERYQSGK